MYNDVMNRVQGFTRGPTNTNPARAFLFERDETGVVHMKFRADPASGPWLGLDGVPDGPGFLTLRSLPEHPPAEVEPKDCRMLPADLAALQNEHTLRMCKDNGRSSNMRWVIDCAKQGRVVTLGRPEVLDKQEDPAPEDRSTWGPLERLGIPSANIDVPIIRRTEYATDTATFWELPEDLLEQERKDELRTRNIRTTPRIPPVRYLLASARNPDEPENAGCVSGQEDDDADETKAPRPSQKNAITVVAPMVYERSLKRCREKAGDASSGLECSNAEDAPADSGSEDIDFGAVWASCKPGIFAAVKLRWEADGARTKGVEVVQVETVDQETETFTGRRVICNLVKQDDAACIHGKWRLGGRSDIVDELHKNNVLAYFSKLNSTKPSLPFEVRSVLSAQKHIFAKQ
jgi:hypothetical protein